MLSVHQVQLTKESKLYYIKNTYINKNKHILKQKKVKTLILSTT